VKIAGFQSYSQSGMARVRIRQGGGFGERGFKSEYQDGFQRAMAIQEMPDYWDGFGPRAWI